jgi:hypothetical protein
LVADLSGRESAAWRAQAASIEPPSAWRARLPNGVVIEGTGELGGVLEALHRL